MSGPYTIYAMHCLFAKDGAPVLGSVGVDERPVIIMELGVWSRMVRDFPDIAKASFNVGIVETKP